MARVTEMTNNDIDNMALQYIVEGMRRGDIPRTFIERIRGNKKVRVEISENMLGDGDIIEVIGILDEQLIASQNNEKTEK